MFILKNKTFNSYGLYLACNYLVLLSPLLNVIVWYICVLIHTKMAQSHGCFLEALIPHHMNLSIQLAAWVSSHVSWLTPEQVVLRDGARWMLQCLLWCILGSHHYFQYVLLEANPKVQVIIFKERETSLHLLKRGVSKNLEASFKPSHFYYL